MKWYDGPCLFRAMNVFNKPNRQILESRPLRIPVWMIYKIRGVGTVVVGKVETGVLREGMCLKVGPYSYENTIC
jgi:elongation factor 1-alpha